MKKFDKVCAVFVGVFFYILSASAIVFLDLSTEHGEVYRDLLYCIPILFIILLFVTVTILKRKLINNGYLRIVGITWDLLLTFAFILFLGVPAIVHHQNHTDLFINFCRFCYACILAMPKIWGYCIPKQESS